MTRIMPVQPVRQRLGRRLTDPGHLTKVRKLGCMVCGYKPATAHHLLKPKIWKKPKDSIRAMSRRSNDKDTVPLCDRHHRMLHDQYGDEDKFFADQMKDPNAGRKFVALLFKTPNCTTCNDRGEVGGFVNAESGYQTDPCPDCGSIPQRDR